MIGQFKHTDITEKIIGLFFTVYNNLGYGFNEKVYENSLCIELKKAGLKTYQQAPIKVHYEYQVVGEYIADILVEDKVILELKATSKISSAHHAQLLNYLKATKYEVGLLLNFGPKAEYKRKAFDNDRKGNLRWISPK